MSSFSICRAATLARLALFSLAAAGAASADVFQSVAQCGPNPAVVNTTATSASASDSFGADCSAQSQAGPSALRVYVSSSDPTTAFGLSKADMLINFSLSDPTLPADAVVVITVPVLYEVSLGAFGGPAGAGSTTSEFTITDNFDLNPILFLSSSSNSFGGNTCPNPNNASLPACNGLYTGTTYASFFAAANSATPQRFYLIVGARSGGGVTDAMHTVTLGNTILPSTMSFSYTTAAGNPLNFAYASSTAVPEPASAACVALGLGLAVLRCRARRR